MSQSFYHGVVPVLTKTLGNLEAIIDKAIAHAAAHKIDDSAFVEARLFPDMFTFARQIRIAGDMAKGAGARLCGIDIPKYEDNEKTLPELKARLTKTIAFLNSLTPDQFKDAPERDIQFKAGPRSFQFKGQDYLQTWVLPNVYFHVTTAYNLLRHGGVEIGKMDFLGKV